MPARTVRVPILAAFAVLMMSQGARSQFVIDRHRGPMPIARGFEIREVAVEARVRDQVAEVRVSQTFHNPNSVAVESEFLFPIPEEGAVQDFVLLVDGKELPGRVLPKDEARRVYEEIVRTRRDPALLEYMGRGLLRTSVFPIPPGADRKVTMRYNQVCRRDRDVVEFLYPFGTQKFTAKPIQRLSLSLRIESRDAIKSVYSPVYDARIERLGDHEARVAFERHDVIPTVDFRLVYTLAEGSIGATVLSERPSHGDDGYFLLLASPEVRPADRAPRPKTVVFVLDRSGSMAGKKIEQARKALRFVLDNLREDDTFNIIAYDDRIESFRPELQRYSPHSRDEAGRFVDNIREGGSTNIDAALRAALAMVPDDDRPSYILFLTDGLPTAGETNEMSIAERCRSANKYRARLFAFGVGYDVNARLLDRLSGGNSGTTEYVKPDEDIEAHVARFYSKMTSPVLTDIRIEFDGLDLNRTYPRDLPDLFEGGQLVWSGRYRRGGRTTVRLTGKVGGERRRFDFPADLADDDRGSRYDFVERIWALRRVGFLIDQIDLHGRSRELTDELVALSTRYGILTPYTSFLADENVPLFSLMQNRARTDANLSELEQVTARSGVAQRHKKKRLQDATQAEEPLMLTQPEQMARMMAASRPSGPQGQNQAGQAPVLGRAGASTPAPAGAATSKMMGGMGMMGGGMGRMNGMAVPGLKVQDAEGNESVTTTVRQVGRKTFYFKQNRWVDATVNPEQDAKANVIAQFSDAFFKLARDQKAELNQYLTFEEPVTVALDGVVYRIEPARDSK